MNQNPNHSQSVVKAAKCVLEAAPMIENRALANIIHNQFNDLPNDEVKRALDLAVWSFNHNHKSVKRNYKSLNRR